MHKHYYEAVFHGSEEAVRKVAPSDLINVLDQGHQ